MKPNEAIRISFLFIFLAVLDISIYAKEVNKVQNRSVAQSFISSKFSGRTIDSIAVLKSDSGSDAEGELKIKTINPIVVAVAGCYFFPDKQIQISVGFVYKRMLTDIF